jgi:hypothetical protein
MAGADGIIVGAGIAAAELLIGTMAADLPTQSRFTGSKAVPRSSS